MKRDPKDVILHNIKKERKPVVRAPRKGDAIDRIVKRIKNKKNGKN